MPRKRKLSKPVETESEQDVERDDSADPDWTETETEQSQISSDSTEETETEDSLKEPAIFDGFTAWFSSSVKPSRIQAWEKEDGLVVDLDTAMYIFSEDAGCEDTKCIYNSDSYLTENLALFHASYIDECLEERNMKQNTIGKYFLPPLELQTAIRQRTRFHWETQDTQKDINRNQKRKKNSSSEVTGKRRKDDSDMDTDDVHGSRRSPRHPNKDLQIKNVSTRTVNTHNMHKNQDNQNLCEVIYSESSLSKQVSSYHGYRSHSNKVSALIEGDPQLLRTPHVELSAYIRVDDLPIAAGPLSEFVPNQNKCEIHYKHPS